MAVTVTSTDTRAILKVLWPQSRVENLVYADHPFLAMVPKSEDFYGENMVIAVRVGDTQGRSATFATAQANISNFQAKKFIITRAKDYQLFSLETEAILATKRDKGALIKALDVEIESAMNNISKSLAISLYRGQSGYLGQLLDDPGTGTTLNLKNPNDVTSFEVGMKIVFSATKTGALRAGGARTISAVNRDTGVLTISAAADAALGSDDYIFAEGDAAAGSSVLKVSGLEDWLPSTAPVLGSDSFMSLDRGSDPTRLAGLRMDVSGLNPEEACVTIFSRQAREGGKPSHLMTNHADYRNIEISLGSKICYEDLKVGEIGFQAIKINGPKGPVRILADQDCPAGRGFALDMRHWKLHSLEKCPQMLDLDGNKLSREASADRWEGRIAYFAQLANSAPGYNANATLPS
jgi:hypothetical protein